MAYEYVNSFLLLLHPHFLIKNGGEANKNKLIDYFMIYPYKMLMEIILLYDALL